MNRAYTDNRGHENNAYAAFLADAARAALIAEVDATPKPGLVDQRNDGAHVDMTRAHFLKSADALQPYFLSVALCGIETAMLAPGEAFLHMRPLGVEAEARMREATGGINTHKGAIFSLGLLLAAAGRLSVSCMVQTLAGTAAALVQGICARELNTHAAGRTKGERAYRLYGAQGVRLEAEKGFPHVINVGLPAYREARANGCDENDALVHALVHLIAHVWDTNVMTRRDDRAALYARDAAATVLAKKLPVGSSVWREVLFALDDDFIARGISPGGCADLVACTHFLCSVCTI